MEIKSVPCRQSFTDTLVELAKEDKNIVAVTTDARGSVTLTKFFKELPEQAVECGIAEQDAVGIAAGLAQSGKNTFVDVAYSQNPVKILGVSGGVAYGALGATHHSLHDVAALRTFPGMNVFLPCDARQTRKLVQALVKYPYPAYVRVGRNAVPDVYENDDFEFEIGKATTLMEGDDLTIIGCGETVYHCLKAGEMLREQGIKARVLDMHTLKPVDEEAILKAARETGKILTVEEHSRYGGLGGIVSELTAEHCPVKMHILGIPDENVVHGKPLEIFHHYKLDAEGIFETALELVK